MKPNKKQCEICNTTTTIDRHHIIPKSKGGTNDHSNLVNLCPNDHRKVHLGLIIIHGWLDLKYTYKLDWEYNTDKPIPL